MTGMGSHNGCQSGVAELVADSSAILNSSYPQAGRQESHAMRCYLVTAAIQPACHLSGHLYQSCHDKQCVSVVAHAACALPLPQPCSRSAGTNMQLAIVLDIDDPAEQDLAATMKQLARLLNKNTCVQPELKEYCTSMGIAELEMIDAWR